MHQLINKKKIYIYIFLFIFLTTINNNNLKAFFKKFFLIEEVNIYSNNIDINKKINFELSYLKNENIFFIDINYLLSKLSKFNYLENVKIKKNYPSKIIINSNVTDLIAITFIDQKKYFVGSNGNFIPVDFFINKKELPIIFGKFDISNFLVLQSKLSNNNIDLKKIIKYYYHQNKRWDLHFSDNIVLMLPNNNLDEAIINYKNFKTNKTLKPNTTIDLRIKNRIIIKNE